MDTKISYGQFYSTALSETEKSHGNTDIRISGNTVLTSSGNIGKQVQELAGKTAEKAQTMVDKASNKINSILNKSSSKPHETTYTPEQIESNKNVFLAYQEAVRDKFGDTVTGVAMGSLPDNVRKYTQRLRAEDIMRAHSQIDKTLSAQQHQNKFFILNQIAPGFHLNGGTSLIISTNRDIHTILCPEFEKKLKLSLAETLKIDMNTTRGPCMLDNIYSKLTFQDKKDIAQNVANVLMPSIKSHIESITVDLSNNDVHTSAARESITSLLTIQQDKAIQQVVRNFCQSAPPAVKLEYDKQMLIDDVARNGFDLNQHFDKLLSVAPSCGDPIAGFVRKLLGEYRSHSLIQTSSIEVETLYNATTASSQFSSCLQTLGNTYNSADTYYSCKYDDCKIIPQAIYDCQDPLARVARAAQDKVVTRKQTEHTESLRDISKALDIGICKAIVDVAKEPSVFLQNSNLISDRFIYIKHDINRLKCAVELTASAPFTQCLRFIQSPHLPVPDNEIRLFKLQMEIALKGLKDINLKHTTQNPDLNKALAIAVSGQIEALTTAINEISRAEKQANLSYTSFKIQCLTNLDFLHSNILEPEAFCSLAESHFKGKLSSTKGFIAEPGQWEKDAYKPVVVGAVKIICTYPKETYESYVELRKAHGKNPIDSKECLKLLTHIKERNDELSKANSALKLEKMSISNYGKEWFISLKASIDSQQQELLQMQQHLTDMLKEKTFATQSSSQIYFEGKSMLHTPQVVGTLSTEHVDHIRGVGNKRSAEGLNDQDILVLSHPGPKNAGQIFTSTGVTRAQYEAGIDTQAAQLIIASMLAGNLEDNKQHPLLVLNKMLGDISMIPNQIWIDLANLSLKHQFSYEQVTSLLFLATKPEMHGSIAALPQLATIDVNMAKEVASICVTERVPQDGLIQSLLEHQIHY